MPRDQRDVKPAIEYVEILYPLTYKDEVHDQTNQVFIVDDQVDLIEKMMDFDDAGWPIWVCGDIAYVFATKE